MSFSKEIEILDQLLKDVDKNDGGIPKRDDPSQYPLSFAQERLWFIQEFDRQSAAYNIPLAIRISGALDLGKLERCFNKIIERHEVLRASFKNINGKPVQEILPIHSHPVPVHDLNSLPVHVREKKARKIAQELSTTPFDLSKGPLFRFVLIKIQEHEHILVLVLHHIISDGWSTRILVQELSTLYQVDEDEWDVRLPEMPITYSDYAAWQRAKFENDDYKVQLSFWKETLGTERSPLALPYDFPKTNTTSHKGSVERFFIPAKWTTKIKQLSKNMGVSTFSILLSSYYVFLHRYCNQKEIIVGTPVANRNQIETESLIGCVSNTIPLKMYVDSSLTVENFIQKVSRATLEAYDNQEVPFEKIVDELKVERSLTQPPIFETMLVYQNQHRSSMSFDQKLTITPYRLQLNESKFDLSLSVMEVDGEYDCFFEYRIELFESSTIKRMVRNFSCILEGMLHQPQHPIREINFLDSEEQEMLNVGQPVIYEKKDLIFQRFERQVELTPEAIAVEDGQRSITYSDMNKKANQLARFMRNKGIREETKVLIMLDRTIDLTIAILAVLKAGGTYIPIDSEQPPSRTKYIIQDSNCQYMLTSSSLLKKNDIDQKIEPICLDIEYEQWSQEEVDNLSLITMSADQAAYMIYTSGSTGKPKGVLNTHYNVTRLLDSTQKHVQFNSEDIWTLFHSIAFDFSVWEMWGSLLNGGRLLIVPDDLRRNPKEYYRFISEKKVTVLNQTPSAFKELVQHVRRDSYPLSLKYVIFGGEALDYQDLSTWFDCYGERTKMINMYGITETTVHVTFREVIKLDVVEGRGSLIGKPLDDLNVYILNEDLLPTPIGVPGEIYVSGAGLARGYYNRPSLTAERYIPNPFSTDGQRLYRTGDLARRMPNGDIEYLGRLDDQVKIKGHRIELGEIQAVIKEDPTVDHCVILVGKNQRGENELAAFVKFRKKSPSEEQLREFRNRLTNRLPRYMYPAHIVAVDSFPVNANGKVNKEQLLALCSSTRGEQVKPETQTEQDLIAIWKKVLGIERLGVFDNYFSLGGDSIRSVQIISELQSRGYDLGIKEIFLYQTVRELAEYLDQQRKHKEEYIRTKPFELISDRDRLAFSDAIEDAYPLTKLQEGMLFHMEQFPDQPIYHNIDSILLEGPFNNDLFNQAVDYVVQNNNMLRTSFDLYSYSVPLQLVHKRATLPVGYEDIRHLTYQEQERVINEFIEQEKKNKFDLSKPSLLRFFVHQRTERTFQFTLTECHLIFDGWSLTSTLSEIFDLYFELLENKNMKWERKTLNVSFSDYVRLEQKAINSESQQAFWKNYLGDCQLLKLNDWGSDSNQYSVEIRRRIVSLPQTVTEKLKKIAAEHKLTMKSMMLAAHIKALQVISGQSDILTGLVSNGRLEVKDGEKVKGLFLNTIPYRLKIAQNRWIDFMRQTFDMEQKIMPYRRYPLPEIQRNVEQSPLFETAFNYVYFHSIEHLFKTKKLKFIDFNKNSANDTHFSLMANFAVHPPDYEIQLTLAFDRNRIPEEKMDGIVNVYRNILMQIAEDPFSYHSNYAYLTKQEYEKVIFEWNRTEKQFPESGKTLQQIIEQQARQTPDHTAIVFESKKLTYAELNQKANQIAQFLHSRGVNNVFVGVYLDRSIDMMVALLGILKAGCAYVPLDTSYPDERINYMISDSGITCILTEKEKLKHIQNLSGDHTTYCLAVNEILNQDTQVSEVFEYHRGSAEDIAYMIYTSGSTGQPKGVMVPHKGIVNRLLWMQAEYHLDSKDRVLQKTPLTFDVSVWELFWPLITGASLIIAKPEGHKDNHYLATLIQEKQITTLHFVPTMLQEFLNEQEAKNCTSLKRVICSGEALTPELKNRFYQKLSTELHNLYGPTEASVDVTYYACRQEDTDVWIGKPISNIQLYVLNEDLQPVGIERMGELFISGIGLAVGYANKPGLTAEKFIPNPFSDQPGSRMYQTGDLVRLKADGNIEYVGRKDSQVKIRGVRIELKEIEAHLRSHSAVKEAIVLLKKSDQDKEEYLVSYIVPEELTVTTTKIKKFLAKRIPDFMQPDRIIFLDKLPVTPNGKVDRKSLPDPTPDRPELDIQYVAPEKPLEKEMVQVFEQVLNVERVGILDNFFELGGNSLKAVFLINHIEKLTGQKFPIKIIFDYPNVQSLAHEILHRNSWAGGIENLRRNDGNQENSRIIVDIQPNGEKQSLFFTAPLGGILPSTVVAGILNLSHAFGKNQPFFGIQTPPLSGELSAELNLNQSSFTEQMSLVRAWEPDENLLQNIALDIVAGIRERQPQGPYLLGGFCTGSYLTLEIVHQLEKQGEYVNGLLIIDSFAPGYNLSQAETEMLNDMTFDGNNPRCIDQMAQSLALFACREIANRKVSLSVQEVADNIKNLQNMSQRWRYLASLLIDSEVIPSDTSAFEIFKLYMLYKLNTEVTRVVLHRYQTKKIQSDITLIVARDGLNLEIHQDPTLGWSKVTDGKVKVNYLPGDQRTTLTEPHVYEIKDIFYKNCK